MQPRRARWIVLAALVLCMSGSTCHSEPPGTDASSRRGEIESIRETLRKYAFFLDDARVEDFLDLFTDDAVFTAAEYVYTGREEIRTELADKERRPGRHLPFPALIELESATEARAWSDFLRVKIASAGDPTSWVITSVGRYYDELVKGADGRWRFRRRDVHVLGMEGPTELVPPPR